MKHAILIFAFITLAITYDFADMLKTESEARAFHVERQEAKQRADREIICKARYRREIDYLECVR